MKSKKLIAFRYLNNVLILVMVLSLGLIACQDSDVNPADDPDNIENNDDSNDPGMSDSDDDPAPDFELIAISGDEIKLSDYEGKVVVLFFLGNTCPSCKAIAPTIEADLHDPYRSNDDYVILGLDQWDGNEESLEAFQTSTGVTFPLLLMASQVASEYSTTYDRLIVIGTDGNIKFKGTSSASSDLDEVKDLVDSLLG